MSGHLRERRRDTYRTGQHSTNDVHTSLEKKTNCDLVNHQHFRLVNESSNRFSHSFYLNFRLVSSTKVKIDFVIVFIYKDPFSSRLSHGKKVVNEYFSSTKLTLYQDRKSTRLNSSHT